MEGSAHIFSREEGVDPPWSSELDKDSQTRLPSAPQAFTQRHPGAGLEQAGPMESNSVIRHAARDIHRLNNYSFGKIYSSNETGHILFIC